VDAALTSSGESRRNVDVKILSESTDETHVEVIVMEQAGAAAGAERVAKPVDPAGADTAKEIVGSCSSGWHSAAR